MYKIHGFIDNKKIIDRRLEHLPRNGDTIRLDDRKYAKVTEVIWCMDEETREGQRVNLRMISLSDKEPALELLATLKDLVQQIENCDGTAQIDTDAAKSLIQKAKNTE